MACDDAIWCRVGRVVEEFVTEQSIPLYLFAFAVGEIGSLKVGPRTRVYAEAAGEVLEAAASEFEGPDKMIRVGERLFGATSGRGEDIAALNIGIGWRGLVEEMERFKDNMEFTKLKTNQEGVDPDDVYSQVSYEKGFQFLWRIEQQIGRPAFDEFLKKSIANFKFQSIDTNMFLNFLKENFPGIENEIDLKLWTEGTGIPSDAMEPVSNIYAKIVLLANELKLGRMPREDEVADWRGQEWELYLENLPKSVEASQLTCLPLHTWSVTQLSVLDAHYRLAESKDYEVQVALLQLAISSRCRDHHSEVEKTLNGSWEDEVPSSTLHCTRTGQRKGRREDLRQTVFSEARDCYHPIAQGIVESILSKHL
ncbi:peptidase M1 family protein [Actinidia rufa]|uniref:Peptidase M1 family protein n=1 Tax=Actinidia rufa TaxID=165716 RepID=A0A7J0EDP4_9ERIC|nr:peptidase M1 family protein [Actinidia rufa]